MDETTNELIRVAERMRESIEDSHKCDMATTAFEDCYGDTDTHALLRDAYLVIHAMRVNAMANRAS